MTRSNCSIRRSIVTIMFLVTSCGGGSSSSVTGVDVDVTTPQDTSVSQDVPETLPPQDIRDVAPVADIMPDNPVDTGVDLPLDVSSDLIPDMFESSDPNDVIADTTDTVIPDVCLPSCGDHECGNNGCGGSCGTCTGGKVCDDGMCVCTPQASKACCNSGNAVCWVDSCGTVGAKVEDCSSGCNAGACNPCVPQCAGKQCGSDGCGGQCGSCAGASCNGLTLTHAATCSAGGTCVAGSTESCNDGFACTNDSCSAGSGCSNVVKANFCLIEEECYSHDQKNPDNTCEYCDSAAIPTVWAQFDDHTVCVASSCSGLDWTAPKTCLSGVCWEGGDTESCNDTNVCTDDSCDTLSGCINTAVKDRACDNATVCDGREKCDAAGVCQPGSAPNCNDANVCTDDSCDPATGCVNTAVKDRACDNATVCDGREKCDGAGVCQPGSAPNCNDSNVCTDDSCDPASGCVNAAVEDRSCDNTTVCDGREVCDAQGICQPGSALNCNDGNVCTDDSCDPTNGCVNAGVKDRACDNATVCDGREKCDAAGVCQPGSAPNCNDSNVCTDDSCDPVTGCANTAVKDRACDNATVCDGREKCDAAGVCQPGSALNCNDSNVCTDDSCDPTTGCVNAGVADRACDNTTVCDGREKCDAAGICQPGSALNCNDSNVCTDDSCDPTTGCVNAGVANRACDNTTVCDGREKCDAAGVCQPGSAPNCDDTNVCTDDSCDAATGCVNAAVEDRACDNATVCDGREVCDVFGICQPGSAPECEDENVCTDDSCDPTTGCVNAGVADRACDNTTVCDGREVCDAAGICQPGSALNCNDSNVCTDDSCDPGTGCVNAAVKDRACDNATVCDGREKCDAAGVCQPGSAPNCNDSNVCTDDSCDPATGCVNTAVEDRACDNATVCDGREVCDVFGICQPGSAPECEDENVCTDDSCDALTGCVNAGVADRACDNTTVCDGREVCDAAGICQPGSALNCNDSNVCTDDSCDPGTGCVNTGVADRACDNTNLCDGHEVCDASGVCQPGSPLALGSPCSDGNLCTVGDTCDDFGGLCVPGPVPSCDDGNECTNDSCDVGTGECVNTPVEFATCDDGKFCTVNDQCDAEGVCTGAARDCTEGGCVTSASCDETNNVCLGNVMPNGTLCNADSNGCTKNDYCVTGKCQAGAPVNCGLTGDWCNTYACVSTGTTYYSCVPSPAPSGRYCDDGLFCTVGETCDGKGHCKDGTARDCSSASTACATGTCSEGTDACVPSLWTDGTLCDDGNACTTATVCKAGFCIGGSSVCGDEDLQISIWKPVAPHIPSLSIFNQWEYWEELYDKSVCETRQAEGGFCCWVSTQFTEYPWSDGTPGCRVWDNRWANECLWEYSVTASELTRLDDDRVMAVWTVGSGSVMMSITSDLSREYQEQVISSTGLPSAVTTVDGISMVSTYLKETTIQRVDAPFDSLTSCAVITSAGSLYRPARNWGSAGSAILGGSSARLLRVTSAGSIEHVRGPGLQQFATGFSDGSFVAVWISDGNVRAQKYASTLALDGPEFQVNSTTGNSPQKPRVAALPNGRYMIYWETSDNDGDIRAQLFRAEPGSKLGSEFTVNTTLPGVQAHPRAAVFPDSSFMVAWEDQNGRDGDGKSVVGRWFTASAVPTTPDKVLNLGWSGNQHQPEATVNTSGDYASVIWRNEATGHIYLRRFDKLGNPDNGIKEILANVTRTGEQSMVAGAALMPATGTPGDASFWLAWASPDTNGLGVFARRYGADGVPVGGEFRVNTHTTGDQKAPDITLDQSGNAILVWQSYGQDGDLEGIFGARYHPDGTRNGSEFAVSTTTLNEQLRPRVAYQPNSAFAVVWETYSAPGGADYDVMLRCFDLYGEPVDNDGLVNLYTTNKQVRPHIAAYPGGSGLYAVVWASYDQVATGSDFDVYLRLINSNCAAATDPILVNQTTNGAQTEPVVAVDSEGQITVAWQSSTGDGSGYGIYARRFNASGVALAGEFKVNRVTTGDQTLPAISILPNRNILLAWQTPDEDGLAAKATRFDYNGTEQALEWMANRTTTGDQGAPRIIARSNGTWVTAWTSMGQDGDGGGIVYRPSNNGDCYNDADCDDQNVCTTNVCVDGKCRASNNTNPCSGDGNLCTENDVCLNGQCQGTPKVCDDSNVCTTDFCNPTTGACRFEGVPACNGGCYYSASPGCGGCQCETNVCAEMPECCIVEWSSQCVYLCVNTYGGCDSAQ